MLRETVAKWTRKSSKIRFLTLKSSMPNFRHVGNFFFWCSMTKMYKYEKLSIDWNLLLPNFHKAGIKNEDFLLIATSSDKFFFFENDLKLTYFFHWWCEIDKNEFLTLEKCQSCWLWPKMAQKWPKKSRNKGDTDDVQFSVCDKLFFDTLFEKSHKMKMWATVGTFHQPNHS